MYSHPCSPTPSTTAVAPEFLTQKRSPATPFIYALPLVAPYKATLPIMIFSSCLNLDSLGGLTTIFPPDNPLPR